MRHYKFEFHLLANMFPLSGGEDFEALSYIVAINRLRGGGVESLQIRARPPAGIGTF